MESPSLFGRLPQKIVQRAVHLTQRNTEVNRVLTIARKKALQEEIQKSFIELFQRDLINAIEWFSVCRK